MAAPDISRVCTPRWHPATRVGFRFCCLYFGLYIFLTQMLTSLILVTTNDSGAFEVDQTRPVQAAVSWVAAHLFHLTAPLVLRETGSGDRVYDWVELACILGLAVVGTLVWSLLDRRRLEYARWFRWLHLIARFALAATLLTYGAFKMFPLQMPYPSLARLLEPFGHFSPMGVLWYSIGSAPAYEIFAGCMEFAAGTLLLFPRTAMLGAMVALADGVQVFMLNMTYDVPVKLLSFHLIPLSLFVLAPDARRLWAALFTHQPAPVSSERKLFSSPRANRWSLAAQVAFALYLIGGNLYGARSSYRMGHPHSPLYGIWNVRSFAYDGRTLPPSLSQTIRWRRVVFDGPQNVMLQDMNEANTYYPVSVDMVSHTLVMKRTRDLAWHADFTFGEPTPTDMLLDGMMDGHHLQVVLTLVPRESFLLVNRGFHWIQDVPYNR